MKQLLQKVLELYIADEVRITMYDVPLCLFTSKLRIEGKITEEEEDKIDDIIKNEMSMLKMQNKVWNNIEQQYTRIGGHMFPPKDKESRIKFLEREIANSK